MGFIDQQPISFEDDIQIQTRGRKKEFDHDLLKLIHKASLITAFASFAYGATAIFLPKGKVNMAISTILGVLFLAVHFFYRYKKLEALKLYFSLIVPLWIMLDTICIGGDFGQSAAFLAITALIYVFYEDQKKLQLTLVSAVLGMYIFTTAFITFYGTIFEEIDQPFDEVLVMIVAVIWIFSILRKRDREMYSLIESLDQKNKRLNAATQELERFTDIASHDLKSPLRNISSFLGLIERDLKKGKTEDLANHLDFAKKGAQQMHYLIQGILEVSSINHQHSHANELHSLNNLMDVAISNLSLEIKEKNGEVTRSNLPAFYCSDVEFILLFQNLLQNGIKYNKSIRPAVNVYAEKTPGDLKIIFEDNGIGIETRFFDYIFEHFKRLHNSNEYMGTGLGLSLCKKIVEKHGGGITVLSELGKGSKFIISLPVRTSLYPFPQP